MVEVVKLNLKDRKILRELDMNARIGINELAKRVGLSRQVVRYRIERMQKEGVMLGAVTVFDSAVVGQSWFRIAIQLHKITPEEKQGFIDYFMKQANTLWIGEVGGNWDFVMNFIISDQFSFNQLFESFLEKWGAFIQKYEVLTYINVRDQQRGYLLQGYETENTEFLHQMKYDGELKLDETDKGIIRLLARDAWASSTSIAAKLGVNYKTIQNRIKEMEKRKLILGYRLMVHPRVLGYESYMVFLGIHSYRPELEKRLYEFLKHPNVIFVVKHLGLWRMGIEVEFSSAEEFQRFLVELRTRFGDIISTYETFPIFRDHLANYFPERALKEIK